eukprot:COSAG05_NODE_56_length_23335_cov_15.221338_21_plen_39_part_00
MVEVSTHSSMIGKPAFMKLTNETWYPACTSAAVEYRQL